MRGGCSTPFQGSDAGKPDHRDRSGDRVRRARLLALLPLALVASACGSKQDALSPHSRAAHGIASLWWNMLIGSSLAFGVVAVILLGAWLRRRREGIPRVRDGDKVALGVVIALGVIVPILVISALFFFSDIFLLHDVSPPTAAAAPADRTRLTIRVVGHQFWWEARYPASGVVTANEIHIPVRTPVEMLLYTRDVIHSFWVPQLNKKQDMLPEQTTRLLLYADKPGRYRGQCAEFCGLQHAHMGMYVFADPPAKFRAWLAREAKPAKGGGRNEALFVSKCGSCHAIRGTAAKGNVGPDLTHVGSRTSLAALTIPNTPERMREWLRDPQRVKPGNQMPAVPMTDAQLASLTAYLEARR
jgi:cytochrome c oxidase subunit 2